MKKIIYITLAFIFAFMLCGCENGSQYEFQDLEMLNDVMNTEMNNFTCKCISSMIVNVGKDEKRMDMELKTCVQENKIYITIKVGENIVEIYEEINGNTLTSYQCIDNGSWNGPIVESATKLEESLGIRNFGEIEDEMFEYKEGVWIGNTKLLEQTLNYNLMSFVNQIVKNTQMDIDQIFLKRFDIEIGYSNLKRQIIEIEFMGKWQDEDYFAKSKYIYNYSKIGNTIVERPQGIEKE